MSAMVLTMSMSESGGKYFCKKLDLKKLDLESVSIHVESTHRPKNLPSRNSFLNVPDGKGSKISKISSKVKIVVECVVAILI